MSTVSLLAALALSASPPMDFNLRDPAGRTHRLDDLRESPIVVVAFLGVECPLAKLYAPRLVELHGKYKTKGAAFVAVASNQHDAVADLHRFSREHALPFPLLKDTGNIAADRFGAQRTPEVFVLDRDRTIRYRGRIDDQYSVGQRRPKPTTTELVDALDALLANRPVAVTATPAPGCPISRVETRTSAANSVTYCKDVAPILQRRCQHCHRPGQAGPFSLLTYAHARNWANAIRENVERGVMPPWSVDPHSLKFANDPSLTANEKKTLFAWIDAGQPEGDRRDLPPPRQFEDGWRIGEPDRVLAMPKPFAVPADGVVDYQYVRIDPGFKHDVWIKAVEVMPGDPAVVHHCNVFLQPPGIDDPKVIAEVGSLGSICVTQYVPGTAPTILPDGAAKLIPAGSRFVLVIHYQPVGTVRRDQTRLGLVFADPKTVRQEVATRLMHDAEFSIPPRTAAHPLSQTWDVHRDVVLLSLFPHMHLRGKSFRYDLILPDGTEKLLLGVPRYDFNWQHRYLLAEPLRIAAGSKIRCSAIYDNSPDNPSNPNPDATVKAGPQSWDEMFNGYFDVVLADEDLLRPLTWSEWIWKKCEWLADRPGLAALIVVVAVTFLCRRRIANRLTGKGR